MKIVKKGSQPLSEHEFSSIKRVSENNKFFKQKRLGLQINQKDKARRAYLDKIISFVDLKSLKPLKIVINSGNGVAGQIIALLIKSYEAEASKSYFVFLLQLPDQSVPNVMSNPIFEESRSASTDVIKREKVDLGVAFDGDFDRCFFFDHLGNFIPGEYVVGLLSEVFLSKQRGSTIVHDPRVVWNTQDVVKNFGGFALSSKTGHSYIKKSMRDNKSGLISDEKFFAHIYTPPLRLIIIGAVHIAQFLAPMAKVAGIDVTVVDPRSSFATPYRFPEISL